MITTDDDSLVFHIYIWVINLSRQKDQKTFGLKYKKH